MTEGHVPEIRPLPDGPLSMKRVERLVDSRGEPIEHGATTALCRCGESKRKPFCDGSHVAAGFRDERLNDGSNDRRVDYEGNGVTIHDNRSICSDAGFCTGNLPSVFLSGQTPWIDPLGADADEIIRVVKLCPSGALSHSVDGVEHRDQERPPAVEVGKNGPYNVTGGVILHHDAHAEGASCEHYALCRCGASHNKPYCDGKHLRTGFIDEED